MSIVSDLASSITGNVESAYLIVKDYRAVGAAGDGSVGTSGENAVSVLQNTAAALSGNVNKLVADIAGDTDKKFKVQFNPKELQIYATSLAHNKADVQRENGIQKNISDTVREPRVELSLTLIFDRVNIYDSFPADRGWMDMNTAQGIKNKVAAVASQKGTVWSVQKELEGLIAALRNQYTRSIVFQWANFSFTGQLSSINANYTMFSASGRPVRAEAKLRLRQKMSGVVLQNWYDDYDSAFTGQSSGAAKTPNLAGLLNLNL